MTVVSSDRLCPDTHLAREILTAEQVVDFLQVSRKSIHNWMRLPKDPLPAYRKGARLFFVRDEVLQWLMESPDRSRRAKPRKPKTTRSA